MRAEDYILVTGATGFVGSTLAAALLTATSCRLLSLARNDQGGERVRSAVSAALTASGGDPGAVERILPLPVDDPTDRPRLEQALLGIRAREAWHVAAHMSYDRNDLAPAVDVNAGLGCALLQGIGGLERLFQISTTSVAGPASRCEPVLVPEAPLTRTEPLNVYTVSKLLAEHMLWNAAGSTGAGLTVLRLPAVVGSGRNGWYNGTRIGYYTYLHVLKRFLGRTEMFRFDIDPDGLIPILHIDQFAEICVRLRDRSDPPRREIYNLCPPQPMRVAEQFEVFERCVDRRIRIGWGPGASAAERTFNRLNDHNNRYMGSRNRFETADLAAAVGTDALPRADEVSLAAVFRHVLDS